MQRLLGVVALLCASALARAEALQWDFRDGKDHGWKALNQVEGWAPSSEGLRMHSRGDDPYIESPPIQHDASQDDVVEVELEVSVAGGAQLFWKRGDAASYAEERSLKFRVDAAGKAVKVTLPVGESSAWQGNILQLRLDPCECVADVRLVALRIVRTPPPPMRAELRVERVDELHFRATLDLLATITFLPSSEKQFAEIHTHPHAVIEEQPDHVELTLEKAGDTQRIAWLIAFNTPGVWPIVVQVGGTDLRAMMAVYPTAPPRFAEEIGDAGDDGAYLKSGATVLLCRGCGFLVFVGSVGSKVGWQPVGWAEFAPMSGTEEKITANDLTPKWPDWVVWEHRLRARDQAGGATAELTVEVEDSGFRGIVTLDSAHTRRTTRALSLLRLHVGDGAFGAEHRGALLPGLEYLGPRETSSSALDDEGPEQMRLAPDRLKLTMPLIAVAGGGRVTGVSWESEDPVSPTFDVPDRLERMPCALMGLDCPPVPDGRAENHLLAASAIPVSDWDGKTFAFSLFALPGEDVTEAVKHYVKHHPLPELPKAPRSAEDQKKLCVATFMDGGLWDEKAHGWGHCIEPNWGRTPAADVCYALSRAEDSDRVHQRVQAVLARIPPEQRMLQGISHVRPEGITLRLGGTIEALKGLKAQADADLAAMREDGSWKYEGKYARGHFEDTALGICAPRVLHLLRYVRMTGSQKHLDAARKGLARLDRFDLPRGAQTWEVPLHTPDILASAQAVEAFVLAYEVTGEKAFLVSAEKWAWTGVPFVYLWGEPGLATMRYATIPVFGATNWQAPAWFGTPVQWCGLVYAWSLYRLAAHDAQGPWKQLADGITLAGMQMQYPDGPRAGCFPDVFYLRAQQRAGPSINPTPLLLLAEYLAGGNPDLRQYNLPGGARGLSCVDLKDVALEEKKLRFDIAQGAPPCEVVVVGLSLEGEHVSAFGEEGAQTVVLSLPGAGHYEFPQR